MIGIDTNILLYERVEGSPFHEPARRFLESLHANPDVAIAELVLVELYLALRNPAIMDPELSAPDAEAQCQALRRHPRWQLIEGGAVMEDVWVQARADDFPRRRIIDARLALTLRAHGVTDLATANTKDFQEFGFRRVWNPLKP